MKQKKNQKYDAKKIKIWKLKYIYVILLWPWLAIINVAQFLPNENERHRSRLDCN